MNFIVEVALWFSQTSFSNIFFQYMYIYSKKTISNMKKWGLYKQFLHFLANVSCQDCLKTSLTTKMITSVAASQAYLEKEFWILRSYM